MWVWEGFYLEDPCELTFANTLLLSNAAISLGNAFINLEISSEYIIFFTLWSFFLSSLFISLQIKEFRILALSINDSLYSSLFFFLTGLHFFHLSIGLILLIYFWSSRRTPVSRSLATFVPSFRSSDGRRPPADDGRMGKEREGTWRAANIRNPPVSPLRLASVGASVVHFFHLPPPLHRLTKWKWREREVSERHEW